MLAGTAQLVAPPAKDVPQTAALDWLVPSTLNDTSGSMLVDALGAGAAYAACAASKAAAATLIVKRRNAIRNPLSYKNGGFCHQNGVKVKGRQKDLNLWLFHSAKAAWRGVAPVGQTIEAAACCVRGPGAHMHCAATGIGR